MPGCLSLGTKIYPRGVYHTVQQGQTLFRIAEVYGLDMQTIQRVNDITNPDAILAGKSLWIPNAIQVLPVPKAGDNPKAMIRTKVAEKNIPPPKKLHGTVKPTKGLFDWPLKVGTLTSKFGNRRGRHHDGIDIAARTGTIIYAAGDGKVVFSGKGPRGYGNMIIIKHSDRLMTVYAHNSFNHVGRSMKVLKGQKIALVGSTGRSTGPHLHFEVRNDTHPVNPILYLPPPKVARVASGIR